jgi:septum site-determining protein MinC
MAEAEISIKGIRSGVLLTLPEGRWTKQHDILIKQLQTQERFFKGGRIALDVGDTEWNLDALRSLLRNVGDEGVCLWAILSTNPVTVQAAESLELATKVKPEKETEVSVDPVPQKPGTLWLTKLPEGEKLVEWDGDLVLLGDLPGGTEVQVTGSVVIWGRAMGTIRFGTQEPDKNHLRLLTCDNPTIYFNVVLIELPKKMRKAQAISVRMVEGQVIIESELRGGFKLI